MTADRKPVASDDGLGRLLFERKPGKGHIAFMMVLTIAPLVVAAVVAFFVIRPPQNPAEAIPWWVPLLIAGITPIFGVGLVHTVRRTFRCHERGIVLSGLRGTRSLMYRDVESFTFAATRMYHNGAYAGTTLNLNLEPAPGGPPPLKYSTTIHNADEMIDSLREQIANVVGHRMCQRALAGEPVEWTPNLRFEGGSVVYRPSGFLGRKEPVAYPLASITTYTFQDGTCQISVAGHAKPVIKEQSNARNFYPGFVCLSLLVGQAQSEVQATSPSQPDA